MTKRRPRFFASVFGKQVAIMLLLALGVPVLISGFFWVLVDADFGASTAAIEADYARLLAANRLRESEAQKLNTQLGVQIRYEGPDGTWAVPPRLPTIAEITSRHVFGPNIDIVPGPDGSRYLFLWTFGYRVRSAHSKLLAVLIGFLLASVVATFAVQKYLLSRPLGVLERGVAQLGEGNLDIVLPSASRDEFGVLTEAFNHMVRRVREQLRARDQLLRDVSHELRSPLTRMKVALELMPPSSATQRMTEDVDEMERMIAELLELERLRDPGGMNVAPHDLVGIVAQEAERQANTPPGVRFHAPPNAIVFDIDAEKMRLVVRNLLENALKYSPDAREPVELSVAESDDCARITCTDHGPGIPQADLASIFEPFFRVDRSRSKTTGGYGLGLSICKRIVEAHGGTIVARNNPGGGASLIIELHRGKSPAR